MTTCKSIGCSRIAVTHDGLCGDCDDARISQHIEQINRQSFRILVALTVLGFCGLALAAMVWRELVK